MLTLKSCTPLFILLLLSFPSYSQTWIRCSNGLPQDTAVASLTKIGDVLFAGTDHAGIYKSLDGGNSWINTHLYDPIRIPLVKSMTTIDTFIFAGQTNNGVARSSLNGTEWTIVNNGIPKGPGYRAIFDIPFCWNCFIRCFQWWWRLYFTGYGRSLVSAV
jgi:hypothetical protein